MSSLQLAHTREGPMAFLFDLSPHTFMIVDEYLNSSRTFGEVLEHKPPTLCQQVLKELSRYVEIRYPGGQVELYFKRKED
jgi:hypothetical protein